LKQSGNTLRQKRIGSFRVVEKIFAADTCLARHEHQTAYVSFLLGGSYSESFLQDERICSPGTVIWHPRTETHADRFHCHGGHLLDLEIEASWLSDAEQELKLVSGARMFRCGLPYLLGLRIYRQLRVDAFETEDAATELLSFFFAGPLDRHRPNWFNRALQICGEFHDEQLSLAKLALFLGVHPVHVACTFRRFLGCTFGDHLAEIRLRKACELLRNSKNPIVDVAHASGYADHAHMCRALKKSTGLTPSAFRKTVQAGLRPSR
jgi:AraC family transcriptional regulator